MQSGTVPTSLRRSSRVPTAVQILVTSLDGKHFSDVCETLVVNAHGCAILTRVKLDAGVPLHLHSTDGRQTTARVVDCQPIGPDQQSWRMGAKLDQPENFWGLKDCPTDWALPVAPRFPKTPAPTTMAASSRFSAPPSADGLADRGAVQLEAQVKRMILESVRPLQAEIVALREKVSRRDTPTALKCRSAASPLSLNNRSRSVCARTLDRRCSTRHASSRRRYWYRPRRRWTSEPAKRMKTSCAGLRKN